MPQNFLYPQRDQPLLMPVDMRELAFGHTPTIQIQLLCTPRLVSAEEPQGASRASHNA
jgi:hypothetical protein